MESDFVTLFTKLFRIVDLIDDYSDLEDKKRVQNTIEDMETNGKKLFVLYYFPIIQSLPKHSTIAEFELKAYNSGAYTIIEKIRYWDGINEYVTIYETSSLMNLIAGISCLILQHFGDWEHLPLLLEQMYGDPLVVYGVKAFINGKGGIENDKD